MKAQTIIRKWSKLRRVPKDHWEKLAQAAQEFYDTLDTDEKKKMIQEFREYIKGVKEGRIIAGPVK